MGLFSKLKKTKQPQPTAPTAPAVEELVVPLLAGQAWKDATDQKLAQIADFPAGSTPYSVEIADGLYATYAADPGPTWEFVSLDSVGNFGGSEQLHRTAIENLRRRGDIRVEGGNGRFAITVPDELDLTASVLLDPERWRAAVTIPGDLIVAAPTRLSVWVCGADDADSVDKLLAAASHGFENGEGKPVSPALYRLSGTQLSRWDAQ